MKLELDINDLSTASLAYGVLSEKRRAICDKISTLCKVQSCYYATSKEYEEYVQTTSRRLSKLTLELSKLNRQITTLLAEHNILNQKLEDVG